MLSVHAQIALSMMRLAVVCTAPAAAGPVDSFAIVLPPDAGSVARRAGDILSWQITNRCGAQVVPVDQAKLCIELTVASGIGQEGYQIVDGPDGSLRIVGNDDPGLVYGVGKFLRTSRYDQGSFMPGAWRGTSVPVCPVRGIYFATHFDNVYEAAPIEEVEEYLSELVLWGFNCVDLHFPLWEYTGFDDPAAQRSLARLKQIMQAAKALGMKVKLVHPVTFHFKSTPKELLATPVYDPLHRRNHLGVNLCPSNPEARRVLLASWSELIDQFADVGLDFVGLWPYDEGGCGCKDCWPWGGRGFPALCRDLAQIARAKFPQIKVIVSTWDFDVPPTGEWEGFARCVHEDKSWLDYVQSDSHTDFPHYPREHGAPEGLPLLNFPEISMWGQGPWGGYGANPFPSRLQQLWDQTQRNLAGGFPYSEGIYEDMNKAVCGQFYWNPDRLASDTVREYVAFEYSPDLVDELSKVVAIFESNHRRDLPIGPSAEEAFRIVQAAEPKLTPYARSAWRWRIFYLRALIDSEMFKTKGRLEGQALKDAFNELTAIYHVEKSRYDATHPPVIR